MFRINHIWLHSQNFPLFEPKINFTKKSFTYTYKKTRTIVINNHRCWGQNYFTRRYRGSHNGLCGGQRLEKLYTKHSKYDIHVETYSIMHMLYYICFLWILCCAFVEFFEIIFWILELLLTYNYAAKIRILFSMNSNSIFYIIFLKVACFLVHNFLLRQMVKHIDYWAFLLFACYIWKVILNIVIDYWIILLGKVQPHIYLHYDMGLCIIFSLNIVCI